jgi:predicted methyltransferase
MRFAFLAAAAALMAVPAGIAVPQPAAAQAADPAMTAALTHARRGVDRARDRHRNPAETLAFFQVRPGMTVVDYMPAGGWYSRILIPYLGEQGTYIALNPAIPADATGFMANMRDTATRFPEQAAGWTGGEGANVAGANSGTVPDELKGTADRVLIFREIHNMMRFGWLYASLMDVRDLLKDDGLVGVVQHRAKADAPASYANGANGYLREQDVVALFKAHGFDLVGSSEINANPNDPANWEGGVWTLPPGYRGAPEGSPRRAELDAIGESDRMTLLFRKRP